MSTRALLLFVLVGSTFLIGYGLHEADARDPRASDSRAGLSKGEANLAAAALDEGRERMRAGEPAAAVAAFERAVALRPTRVDAWLELARACRAAGGETMGARALEAALRASALEPEDVEVRVELVLAHSALGHTTEALDALRRAFELDPSRASAVAQDHDFDELRRHPSFDRILHGAGSAVPSPR